MSLFSILTRIDSKEVACSTSLPTHAPSVHIRFPSLAMFTMSCRGSSMSFSFHCCTTCSLWSLVPIGRISVFSKLNFAPDAIHQSFRMSSKLEYLSFNNKYIVDCLHTCSLPPYHLGPVF